MTNLTEEPISIFRIIREAAEGGFTLDDETMEAIHKKSHLLRWTGVSEIRQEFERIVTAEFAGNGLRMIEDAGLLFYIVSTLAEMMPKGTKTQLSVLMDNIDKTKRVRERRLGLFYLCFEKRRALEVIERFEYDEPTASLLYDGLKYIDAMNFLRTEQELKRFAARRGRESYEYLESLAKAQRIVYGLPEEGILNRHRMMQKIIENKEPVYTEDLAITSDDLLDNDIAAGKKAEQILDALLALIHKQPQLNTKKTLLFYAKKYAKTPFLPAYEKMGSFLR